MTTPKQPFLSAIRINSIATLYRSYRNVSRERYGMIKSHRTMPSPKLCPDA